jgi:hypothetical protein
MIKQQDSVETFRKMIGEVAQQLVRAEHHVGSSMISLPLLYPSGANVVVRVEGSDDRFFVSDAGFGYHEADFMGASLIYARNGKSIAENAGVRFDNQAFFVIEASRDQIPGAIVTIGNCSQEATALAAYKLAERRSVDEGEALYERLIQIFPRENIAKDVEIIGSSSTKWPVTALVTVGSGTQKAIFEPVTKYHASVVNAAAKFHDISRLPHAPARVVIIRKKAEFGPWLGLLSQAASVIDADVPNSTLLKLAEAA